METVVVPLSECKVKSFFYNGKIFALKSLAIQKKSIPLHPQLKIIAQQTCWCHSSVGRAKDWKSLCPRFDSWWYHNKESYSNRGTLFLFFIGAIAQLVEQRTDRVYNWPCVPGSIPFRRAIRNPNCLNMSSWDFYFYKIANILPT